MKLTREDIEKQEEVGKSEKGLPLIHIRTKGGRSYIVEKTEGGQLNVLGEAHHFGHAKHNADRSGNKVQWNESLFKTEETLSKGKVKAEVMEKNDKPANPYMHPPEFWEAKARTDEIDPLTGHRYLSSVPAHHMELASWHSKLAGTYLKHPETAPSKENKLDALYHSDQAMKHYQMAGLDRKAASEQHQANMNKPHDPSQPIPQVPHHGQALQMAWIRKHNRHVPEGMGFGGWAK